MSVEIIRKVWDDSGKGCIEVGEWPDDSGLIEIRTADDDSKEWFGPLNLAMLPAVALELGEALVAAAKEKGA